MLHCGGTRGFLTANSAQGGKVTINLPAYNCGDNRPHVKRGFKIYRAMYVTVTDLHEKKYESGKQECSADSYLAWSYAVSNTQDCVYK